MKRLLLFVLLLATVTFSFAACSSDAKAEESSASTGKYLVIYYSRSGNTKMMADEIAKKTGAETLAVVPADDYSDYQTALNLDKEQLADIDNNNKYPDTKTEVESFTKYDAIFICTPLWWSRMSIPMQAFLHAHADKLAGKQIYFGATSASSGISQVIADCKRLLPKSTVSDETLWINDSNRNQNNSLVDKWIESLNLPSSTSTAFNMNITVNGKTYTATMVENSSTDALKEILAKQDITYEAHDYGNFEKVGDIGHTLPQNDENINTEPGDIILYQGHNICIYYATNTYDFTRLGKIVNITQSELKNFLNAGGDNITVTLSLSPATGISSVKTNKKSDGSIYDLSGRKMARANMNEGIYIADGKKFINHK